MLIQTLIINVWLGRTVPDLWEVMSSRSCRPSCRRLSFRALWLSTLSLKLYTHMNTETTCQCKTFRNEEFFFFYSFILSVLFRFPSYLPLEHLYTHMHTKQHHLFCSGVAFSLLKRVNGSQNPPFRLLRNNKIFKKIIFKNIRIKKLKKKTSK